MTDQKPTASTAQFESSLKELETLVETIENGQLSLDESLEVFEKGIKLTQFCQKTLNEAEQKIQILTEAQTLEELGDKELSHE